MPNISKPIGTEFAIFKNGFRMPATGCATTAPELFCADAPSKTSTGDAESAPVFTQEANPVTTFTKLAAIRKHLRLVPEADKKANPPAPVQPETGKRVQKNLSLLERDAERLAALAKRDGISQARLLSAALDAYEATKFGTEKSN
jgi:hypothetical protein